jgi:hypothetical protein
MEADARCLDVSTALPAYAHVCASVHPEHRIPFDDPSVQQARRDALGWWIPLLGDSFVCLTTLAVDSVYCAGAVTVAREARGFEDDPFERLFAGTTLETAIFSPVPPPPGPVIERYGGAAWPAI